MVVSSEWQFQPESVAERTTKRTWIRRATAAKASPRAKAKAQKMGASLVAVIIMLQNAPRVRARERGSPITAKVPAKISREKVGARAGFLRERGTSFTQDHRRAPGVLGIHTKEEKEEERPQKDEKVEWDSWETRSTRRTGSP